MFIINLLSETEYMDQSEFIFSRMVRYSTPYLGVSCLVRLPNGTEYFRISLMEQSY